MHELEQLLRSYLEDRARTEYLKMAVRNLPNEQQDVIYAMGASPRGGKNPTQFAALGYREQIKREQSILEKEIFRLQKRVRHVEILLGALTPRERLIIQAFYIDGQTWDEVVERFTREMPSGRGKTTLKAMRDQILKKLLRISEDGGKHEAG